MKKRNTIKSSLYQTALWSCTLLSSPLLMAAGFQIHEQNVTNLGTAYSGTAALSADASTNFYNAAGLTHIEHTQFLVSAVGLNGKFDLYPQLANPTLPANSPISPLTAENAGGFNPVPSFHMAHPFGEKFVFGLSVTPSFGLKTEYDDTSVARYVATRSELITFLISPSLAYRINDQWSFAFGVDAQYAKARLDASIGSNNIISPDGYSKNEGDDWAWSLHAGLLFELDEFTRVGLSYRGKFSYSVKGTNLLNLPNIPGIGTGIDTLRVVHTNLTLPETAILSAYHEFNNKFALMADVHWTAWHRFKALTLEYAPPGPANDSITVEDWNDNWRFALGGQYQGNDKWTLRAGVAYDISPVPDERRTARIPDSDRIWLALGVGYDLCSNIHLDAGYAHIFFKNANVNDRGPDTSRATFQQLIGHYKSKADIFGVQLRIDFV